MAFTAITSSQTDADSPIDTTLMDTIRTNFDDHDTRVTTLEGTLGDHSAGSYFIHANSVERTTSSATYVKLKETKIGRGGSYRIKFYLTAVTGWVYARVYRNGSAVGTEQSLDGGQESEFSEDISGWSNDDLLQVYGKTVNGGQICKVKDLKLEVADPLEAGNHISY